MITKLLSNDELLLEFLANRLPFRHYYLFKDKIQEPKEGQWITNMWEFLKKELVEDTKSI